MSGGALELVTGGWRCVAAAIIATRIIDLNFGRLGNRSLQNKKLEPNWLVTRTRRI